SAIRTTTASAHAASWRVTGSARASVRLTGMPLSREYPRSPRTSRVTHRPYWTGIGASTPRYARSAWSWSGVARSPRITSAGSPGSAATIANTRSEARTTVRIASPTRRSRYAVTNRSPASARRSPVEPRVAERQDHLGVHLEPLDRLREPEGRQPERDRQAP